MPANEIDSGPMPVVAPGPPRPGPGGAPDREVLDSARFQLAFHEAVGGAGPMPAGTGPAPPADGPPDGGPPAGGPPAGGPPASPSPAERAQARRSLAERSQADLRAVTTMLEMSQADPQHPAGPLDLGAGLVLLGNLRLYLDRLEAGLLETAEQTGLSWDLIAAIIGIPATDARGRLALLRARPDPQ